MQRIVFALAALLVATSLHAQHCKKGVPCGNSCISASKTCRVGQGTAWGGPSSTDPTTKSAETTKPARRTSSTWPDVRLVTEGGRAVADTSAPFVASPTLKTYFAKTCDAAKLVPAQEAARFRTREAAELAGFAKSPAPGC